MSAVDLDGGRMTAQIVSAEMTTFKTGEPSLMLTLQHGTPAPKLVRCNQTNRSALAGAYGWDTDAWVHKHIELWVEPTSMGPGIRMRPLDGSTQNTGPAWTPPLKSTKAAPPVYPVPKSKGANVGGGPIEDDELPFAPCVQ
jgi:hypothetical protein